MAMFDLEAIKARIEAATTGPWTHEIGEYSGDNWLIGSLYLGTGLDNNTHTVHVTTDHIHASELWGEGAGGDADFIAHAREDVPALVAEVERLQAEAEAVREKVEWYDMMHTPEPAWVREVEELYKD